MTRRVPIGPTRAYVISMPTADTAHLLEALTLIAAGDWEGAHNIAQDDDSPEAAWVHALLHRIEGDDGNAAYWYRRAGKPMATGDVDAERRAIEAALRGGA